MNDETPHARGAPPNSNKHKRNKQPRMVTICRHCGAASFDTLKEGHGWFLKHVSEAHGISTREERRAA
jgi:hypothetical protein